MKEKAFDTLVEDEEKAELKEQEENEEIKKIESSYVAGDISFRRINPFIFAKFRKPPQTQVCDARPAGCGQVKHRQQSPWV